MASAQSRRSFFVESMQWVAKAWILLTGAGVAGAGCDDVATKYGGPPPARDLSTDDAPVVKYGGPPDLKPEDGPPPDLSPDDAPVAKYGGPPVDMTPIDGPSTKYGGPLVG